MAETKRFGIVEDIPPNSTEESLGILVSECQVLGHALYALLTPGTWRKIYKCPDYQNWLEAIRESQRSLGTRAPRNKIAEKDITR